MVALMQTECATKIKKKIKKTYRLVRQHQKLTRNYCPTQKYYSMLAAAQSFHWNLIIKNINHLIYVNLLVVYTISHPHIITTGCSRSCCPIRGRCRSGSAKHIRKRIAQLQQIIGSFWLCCSRRATVGALEISIWCTATK